MSADPVQALAFAAERHANQRRKDAAASPYINHPVAVARILAEAGINDPITLCAALLHDTIEDTPTTAEEIRGIFGDAVAGVVLELTDDKSLPKAERKRLQVVRAADKSERARLVKIADKISNLHDLATCPPRDWSIQDRHVYCRLAKSVVDQIRGTHPVLESRFDAAYQQVFAATAA